MRRLVLRGAAVMVEVDVVLVICNGGCRDACRGSARCRRAVWARVGRVGLLGQGREPGVLVGRGVGWPALKVGREGADICQVRRRI